MVLKYEDPVVIGITGASGSSLGYKTVQYLLENDYKVIVTNTSSARLVWKQEMDESFGEILEKWSEYKGFQYFSGNDLSASIASGSFKTLGMAIVPCSMNTIEDQGSVDEDKNKSIKNQESDPLDDDIPF